VTLLNSPFWTFHPVYCKNVHIHHIEIQIPWGGFNGDGIDVDSCQNVLIEHNYINCGKRRTSQPTEPLSQKGMVTLHYKPCPKPCCTPIQTT